MARKKMDHTSGLHGRTEGDARLAMESTPAGLPHAGSAEPPSLRPGGRCGGQHRPVCALSPSYVGYAGPIVSFEPVYSLFDTLSARAAEDARWTVYPFVLGAASGDSPLHIMEGDTLHSFLPPTLSGIERLDSLTRIVRSETVSVRTLDEMLSREELSSFRSVFLKMNTQGFDGEVLKGAGGSLSRIAALQSEISCIPIYRNMTDWLTSRKDFEERGFTVTGMFPVNRDEHFGWSNSIVWLSTRCTQVSCQVKSAPHGRTERAEKPDGAVVFVNRHRQTKRSR